MRAQQPLGPYEVVVIVVLLHGEISVPAGITRKCRSTILTQGAERSFEGCRARLAPPHESPEHHKLSDLLPEFFETQELL